MWVWRLRTKGFAFHCNAVMEWLGWTSGLYLVVVGRVKSITSHTTKIYPSYQSKISASMLSCYLALHSKSLSRPSISAHQTGEPAPTLRPSAD